MFDVLVYALLRKYIKDSLVGAGALKGASCQIQSITRNDDNNANIVTYKWEDNAGGLHTSQMVVYDGAIGPKGDKGDAGDKGNKGDKGDTGKGITNIEQLDDSNQIIVHYDDGTQEGPFTIPTIKGDPGEDGVDGETPTVEVGTVETVDYTAGAEITPRETPTGIVLDFKIPRGRPGEGGESAIADMTDVVLSNLKTGQILKYDKETGKWYNADGVEINELGDIKDVALSNLKAGQTLIWDAENSKWKNADAVNPTQFDTMPEASEYATKVIQYTGADTANYKRGYFYRSTPSIVSGELVYSWVQTNTQPSNNDYEDLANKPAVNGVELSGDKTSDDLGIQGKIQFTALPLASSANRGKIIQYVGASTDVLKKGYWYTCTYNSDSDTFSWVESDISGNTELANRIATLEQNQGDMTQIEVATATSLVDALNKLNAKGQIDRYEYNEPYLIIYYHDGHTFQVSVGTILNDLQIGELANVIDETITDGQILQYDSSIQKYKPYAILATLQTLLQNAKDYADEEILKAIQVGAYVCDEKPQYDAENDTVIYKQGGAIKTTTNTSARFYYTIIGEGSFFTSWIEDVEFTSSVAAVNFDDYVNKNTDVVSDYSEDMVDKTKIPDIASLDALLTIVKTALGLKVNTADIIDNLTSVDTTKPLSANQGKVLKDELDTKQKQIQYTEMPVASVDWLGETLQYKGATSSAFTHNMWYECKYDNTAAEYYWDEVKYGADVDSELDEKSSNPVANSVLTPEIKSRLKQYSVMPEPSLALFKAIVQYTGDTNSEYTNGLFYKCLQVGNEFVWSPTNSLGSYGMLSFSSVEALTNAISTMGLINETEVYIRNNETSYVLTGRNDGDTEDSCIFVSADKKLVPNTRVANKTINIKAFGGVANANTLDNSRKLAKAIKYACNSGLKLIVPRGTFILKETVTITGRLVIEGLTSNGNLGSFNIPGSSLKFDPESGDTSMFIDEGYNQLSIRHLNLICDYTTFTSSFDESQEIPHEYFTWAYLYPNVNCLQTVGTVLDVSDITISGFSGYALRCRANTSMTNITITRCKFGFYNCATDSIFQNCYVSGCERAFYWNNAGTVIFAYDVWIDQCGYGLFSAAALHGVFTGIMDHLLYSAVYAKNSNNGLKIEGRFGRIGMYYLGKDMKAYAPDTYSDSAFNDIAKGVFFAIKESSSLELNISVVPRSLSDTESSDLKLPTLLAYGDRWKNAIIQCAYDFGEYTYKLTDEANSNINVINSSKNSSGRYNVLDFGLKRDNVTDNSSAFSSLLSKVPYGAVIYFPSGMYRFESPIVLTKGVSLVGDTNFDKMPVPNSAIYRPISGIIFAGSTENTTFITRSSGLSCSFSNLSFYCAGKDDSLNSYKISNNDEAFVSLPYPFFKESMDREAVNGLDMNNSGALAVHDCTFAGFTGFALSITQHIFVDRCDFRNCNIGIRVSATDCWISNCHFVGGGIGVFSPQTLSNILINISDTWFDQMAHNAIRLESGSNVILANNLWIDMIDEAGICVPNGILRRSNITGRLSRCGMSYAGLESESWSTAVSPYADAISAYTLYNSYINVSVERRAIGLGNNSTGVCAHYVIGITHNDILNECNIITDTSADYVSNGRGNGSTINANGKMTFRNNIFDYKYAPILFRSKTPKSFVTPFESDILSIDSSTGKIYKSNGTTKEDWEELHCGDKTFPGTLEEWNALTPAEKAKYDFVVTPEEANTKAPFEDITSQIVLQNGTDGNPLFTSGSGTDWDIFSCVKYGNVVVFSVCFGTFSGKVNSGYVCFRGLPKAALPAETGGSFDTRWFINKNDNYIQLYFSRPSSELENTATRFQLVYFTND